MHLYFALLKEFLTYQTFAKYENSIDQRHLKENYPEIFRLFQCIKYLHREGAEKVYSPMDLLLALKVLYPASNENDYSPLIQQIENSGADPSQVGAYLRTMQDRQKALLLAEAAVGFAQGHKTAEEYQKVLGDTSIQVQESYDPEDSPFVTTDLDQLIERTHGTPGLRWRLRSLNERLGSLRKGDFGFIFARPETGKTTLLASEVAHLIPQILDNRPGLWINNEEQGEKVAYRVYQAVVGRTPIDLERTKTESKATYQQVMGNRFCLVDDAGITASRINQLCEIYKPGLIILDQIDKIRGFQDDRSDLELTAIYSWARELAKRYGPVIGVSQAGQSAEGKRWLTMNDVNNSKTGKQGEADWILGIGKDSDLSLETYRYFYLSKNKLSGDADTNPALRHDRWEVRIRPDIARYEDI